MLPVPYRGRPRYGGWVIPAAAAAQEVVRQGARYLTRPNFAPPVQLAVAPSNAQARGGSRRRNSGRGRGRGARRNAGNAPNINRLATQMGSLSMSGAGGAMVTIQDTEVVNLFAADASVVIFQFNPDGAVATIDGTTGAITTAPKMARLKAHAAMYTRYRFLYVRIVYRPAVGSTEAGIVCFGIIPGKPVVVSKASPVKDADAIMKMAPRHIGPVWRGGQVVVGRGIDSQRFMMCDLEADDSVSFTMYAYATKKDSGYFEISYKVQFAYPRNF